MNPEKSNSPAAARFLMKLFLSKADYDQLTGDFEEFYNHILETKNKGSADIWYWLQLVKCLPNFIIFSIYWGGAMFKNYFKIALRNIIKHKGYAFINITGLAIGLASCLLIMLFVMDELSYDNFHEKGDRIYRLERKGEWKGQAFHAPTTAHGYGPSIISSIPEIESYVRIDGLFLTLLDKNNNTNQEGIYFADHNMFTDFSYKLKFGDPEKALVQPNSLVMTPEMAKKYFGEENAVGKSLRMEWGKDLITLNVTGIMEKMPGNTHLNSQLLISYSSLNKLFGEKVLNELRSNGMYTYLVLKEGSTIEEVAPKLTAWFNDKIGNTFKEMLGKDFDITKVMELQARPLKDIHLYANLMWELEPQGDIKIVIIFLGIAILLLVIACINFMNLSTARSAGRAKEVGLRKVVGATRKYLMNQFLAESVFFTLIAVIVGLLLVQAALPWFNSFTMKNLELNVFENPMLIGLLIGITLITGIGAGLYPAMFLSSFQPAKVLQGTSKSGTGGKSSGFRNILVISQFAITISLMIGTLTLIQQMNYVKNRDLGFEKEQLLVVNITDNLLAEKLKVLLPELNKHPNVVSSSVSRRIPGSKNVSDSAVKLKEAPKDNFEIANFNSIDEHYLPTMGIELIAGRNFSEERKSELKEGFIINENLSKKLGFKAPEDAIDRYVQTLGRNGYQNFKIIGVVKDFHFKPLQQKIEPLVMRNATKYSRHISIRIKNSEIPITIDFVRSTIEKFSSSNDFEYFFLDEHFDAQYRKEERTQELFSYFSILAIFIACLGLFGLAAYITEKRTKEIGIRKVMGANVKQIIGMLSKEFLKWVLLANIAAWPLGYYFMDNWLNNFAYRIDIGFIPFIFSAILALFIALSTVTYQTYKAAIANPIESIHCE